MSISNNYNHVRVNGNIGTKQKLARRQQIKDEQKRSDLLAKILEESSSLTLNDPTSQLSARQAIENHSKLFDLIAELRAIESKLNPKLPVRDEKSWSQFIEWFSSKELEVCNGKSRDIDGDAADGEHKRLFDQVGVKRQSESCAIDDETDEFSLVAKVPFKKGERIFKIDRRLMLTTETAMKDSDLYEFIRKDSIASGMQNVVLVLHLLNEFSKREQSQWWSYLSILPNKILPILHMNKEQISTYLMASAHLHTALKMLRAIIRQYSYFYKRLQSTKLPMRHDFTYLYYTWGVSMVCSRQNEIPHSRYVNKSIHHKRINNNNYEQDHDHKDVDPPTCPKSVHALIPVLDMCNHNRHSNQATFEHDASCLEACTELLPNQEITINYGCRSSGDFYIHNGFVPDEVSFDMVGLTLALNQKQDPLFEEKVKILRILNMSMTFGEFTLRSNDYENRHRRDPHLTMFLIVNFLNNEEIDFMLASENPVGVADEIYDFIQYESCELDELQLQAQGGATGHSTGASIRTSAQAADGQCQVDKMKRRLLICIRDYISRRASIGIALIDRTIEILKERQVNAELKLFTIRLLQHEKKIYESHVSK